VRKENPFQTASLCVVGNINRDVKVQAVRGSPSLLQDGETSVKAISETIGGGGANSACAAAALGARVNFVGKVGDDALGEQLQRAMEKHGVETYLARNSDCASGTSVALGFAGGQRHFLSCLPNNETLGFEDLNLAALSKCRHLLRADVWFSRQMLEEGNERLLCKAREAGLATSLDINFDPVWSSGSSREIRDRKQLLRKVLPLVDIAHGNVRELREFTNTPDLGAALKQLGKWGVRCVVVHLGTRGAGFYRDGKFLVEPANPARRAIHSTGTGDVLSICMILLSENDKLSPQQKLRLSNRVVREFMEGRRSLIPAL
jgi:sugar/nucleoside kinase (ribokinase family)